jgi:transposase
MNAGEVPVGVFVGVDIGKTEHHAVALDAAGKVLLDRPLPQDERRLRELVWDLKGRGRVLFVVDQPATIGALPLAVAKAEGVEVGYLPGLAMRRIADLYPGEAKTDARDAAIIAEAARSMPHALRSLRTDDEQTAELAMLSGFDEDLAGQINQVSNRIRGLLTQIHPALERVVGPRLQHPATLDLLQRYPSPQALRAAGRARLLARARTRAPRLAERLVEEISCSASRGTTCAAAAVPVTTMPWASRRWIAEQVEALSTRTLFPGS